MSKARLVITAVVVEGRTHAQAAADYGVSRSWVTRLVARWRLGGDTAFEPRSRRPNTSPSRTDAAVVELICELRRQLTATGLDAGPETIRWHLSHHHGIDVSVSTIRRHLVAAGLVTPEPRKRPKSSYVRFEAALPNETWQTDMCHWRLAGGTGAEILSFIDDCSRCALSVSAHRSVGVTTVVDAFRETAARCGIPASVLSDNAMYFTTRFARGKGGPNAFETLLANLGVTHKHSRPNHPRTCGKVERFQPDPRVGSRCSYVSRHHSVGQAGFEPTTSSSRTRRATKLRHCPCAARGMLARWKRAGNPVACAPEQHPLLGSRFWRADRLA